MAATIIICILLAAALLFGIRSTIKHSTGNGGGCCGDGSSTIRDEKTLAGPIIKSKTFMIEGMSCTNCENRICRVVNKIDGVAINRIKWKKGTAVIDYEKEVDDEIIREAIEKSGYKVTEIR